MKENLNTSREWNESGTHNRPMNAYDAYRHLRFPNIQLPNICWSFVHQINRRRPIWHGWDRARQSNYRLNKYNRPYELCHQKQVGICIQITYGPVHANNATKKKLKEKRTFESVFCCLVRDGSIYDGVGKILVKNVGERLNDKIRYTQNMNYAQRWQAFQHNPVFQ